MKLVDEKRAIQDISAAKRQRRVIEGFQTQQDAIDAEKAKADELRKQLDDPELKAVSERYDAIRTELDALKKEGDESYASRNVLFDERTELQNQVDELWVKKKASAQKYREAQDAYWARAQEERAKKAEKARLARQAIEDEKKQEVVETLREGASVPAYQSQIEDCQTLIDFFSKSNSTSSTGLELKSEGPAIVPELDLRKVDAAIDKNLVHLKKKKGDDDNYFVATKKVKGAKKVPSKANQDGTVPPEPTPAAVNERFSVSLAKLGALASLSIPAPTSAAEVPQTIENLKIKKAWFLANQEKQTATNKAKAEEKIAALLQSMNGHSKGIESAEQSRPETPKTAAAEEAVEA